MKLTTHLKTKGLKINRNAVFKILLTFTCAGWNSIVADTYSSGSWIQVVRTIFKLGNYKIFKQDVEFVANLTAIRSISKEREKLLCGTAKESDSTYNSPFALLGTVPGRGARVRLTLDQFSHSPITITAIRSLNFFRMCL